MQAAFEDDIHYSSLSLNGLTVTCKDFTYVSDSYDFHATSISAKPSGLSLDLNFEDPELSFKRGDNFKWENKRTFFGALGKWFKILPHFSVGRIHFQEQKLSYYIKQQQEGHYIIHANQEFIGEGGLEVDWERRSRRVRFGSFDMTELSKCIDFFNPSFSWGLQVSCGKIDGYIDFEDWDKRKFLEGSLKIRDFQCSFPSTTSLISCSAGIIELEKDCLYVSMEGSLARGSIEKEMLLHSHYRFCSPDVFDVYLKFEKSELNASFSDDAEGCRELKGELLKIQGEEFGLLQDFVAIVFPEFSDLSLEEGELTGAFKAYFSDTKCQRIQCKDFLATKLKMISPKWNLAAGCEKLEGHCILKLDLLKHWGIEDGSLNLHEGFISMGNSLTMEHLHSIQEVKNGQLLVSSTQMNSGDAMLFGTLSEKTYTLTANGKTADLLCFLPAALRRDLGQGHTELTIKAHQLERGFRIEGNLRQDDETIDLAFSLRKASSLYWEEFWRCFSRPYQDQKWTQTIEEKTQFLSYTIAEGSFSSSFLDLKRWTGLLEQYLKFGGKGKLQGVFNATGLRLCLLGKDIIVENSYFRAQSPEVEKATFLWLWNDQQLIGHIPVSKGGFEVANKHLQFELNKPCLLHLNNRTFKAENLDVVSKEVLFQGNIDVNFPYPDIVSVDMYCSNIEGSFFAVQNFLEPFGFGTYGKIPMEAFINLSSWKNFVHIACEQNIWKTSAYVTGIMSQGSMTQPGIQSALENFSMDFEYWSGNKTLCAKNGVGDLMIEGLSDTYRLFVPQIMLYHSIEDEHFDFDIRIESQINEVMHFLGKAHPLQSPDGSKLLSLEMNEEKTFIGNIRPHFRTLEVRNWTEFASVSLDPVIDVSTVAVDFIPLAHMFFSPKIAAHWDAFQLKNSSGNLQLHIDYKSLDDTCEFSFGGKDLIIMSQPIQTLTGYGNGSHGKWTLTKANINDLGLYVEYCFNEDSCYFQRVDIQHGDLSRLQFAGRLAWEDKLFYADSIKGVLDLEALWKTGYFDSAYAFRDIQGSLEISGLGTIHFPSIEHSWLGEGDFKFSYKGLKIQEIDFGDAQDVHCKLLPQGIAFDSFKGEIKNFGQTIVGAAFEIKNLEYYPKQASWKLEDMYLKVPAEKLIAVLRFVGKELDLSLNSTLFEVIEQSKKEEPLGATLSIQSNAGDLQARVRLDKGKYVFGEVEHDLGDLVLLWNEESLQITADYILNENHIPLMIRTFPFDPHRGEMILGDKKEDPLIIRWAWLGGNNLTIRSIAGSLMGLNVKMVRDELRSSRFEAVLQGHISVNMHKLAQLCPETIQTLCKRFRLGAGYSLSGTFIFPHGSLKDYSFYGTLEGNECDFMGYSIKSCRATVYIDPRNVILEGFRLNDLGGYLEVPSMILEKKEDKHWYCTVPHVHIEELRPSILRKNHYDTIHPRAFVVHQCNFYNISGCSSNSNSFSGEGSLTFSNKTKSNYHSLLTLPMDIITRLGLDVSLFVPVSGKVHFVVKDNKMVFKDFEDVYSRNKGSQFFLAEGKAPSTMDFEGNLDIKIRVKQYNIIFKLAEIFTIYVHGSIDKPLYAMQKGKKQKIAA